MIDLDMVSRLGFNIYTSHLHFKAACIWMYINLYSYSYSFSSVAQFAFYQHKIFQFAFCYVSRSKLWICWCNYCTSSLWCGLHLEYSRQGKFVGVVEFSLETAGILGSENVPKEAFGFKQGHMYKEYIHGVLEMYKMYKRRMHIKMT